MRPPTSSRSTSLARASYDAILADSQRLIERYHQRSEDAMVRIALAPCSPFSVTTSLMRSTAELVSRKQVR